MTLTTDATRFKAALTHIKKTGAAGRVTLPALAQVQVSWGYGMVVLTSTDLELQLSAIYDTETGDSEGELLIPWPQLLAATEGSMNGKEITISEDEAGIRLKVGRKEIVKQNTIEDDLPVIDYDLDEVATFSDPRWHKVVQAAAGDDSRPVLAGVHLATDSDGVLWMDAADGFRMARIPSHKVLAECNMTIPARAFRNVPKGNPVTIYSGLDMHAIIGYQISHAINIVACVRVIEGQYPDLSQITPQQDAAQHVITVRSDDVVEASKHALKYGTQKGLVLFSDGSISAKSSDVGTVEFNGYEHGITEDYALNGEYLIWACEGDDELELFLQAPNSPVLVVDGPLSMVIMPMVVGAN